MTTLTDTLRPILTGYRAEVQPHWSPATAHPEFDGKAGDPAGQCGVTSAWLQRRLREDHGIETAYAVGAVYAESGGEWRHCWLELNDDPNYSILDLTIDQFPEGEGLPVICDDYRDLYNLGLDYESDIYLTAEQLLADPVQGRLAVLTAAVGR